MAIDALLLEDLTTLFIDFDCQSDRGFLPANVLRWQRRHYTHYMLRRMKGAIALVDKR